MTLESRQNRLKRMTMRSWRRGLKEMDLILGPFADQRLAAMTEVKLQQYDRLLEENDHDLYGWISGHISTPASFLDLIREISAHAKSA